MNRHTRPRGATLALPALLAAAALAAVLALGAPGGGGTAMADAHAAGDHAVTPARQLALRQDMRAVWEDHITWTRMVIVDFAADLPSLPASQARLLRNQADIGAAIAPYYGRAAGKRLTGLLREHILIAVDVLTAAKAGDAPGLTQAQARWTGNAHQIADFLSSANPAWPRAEMRRMMRRHLKLTTDEAVARLTGDFSADVRAYDRVHTQILEMADMLSAGIIRQFPRRFREAA
ncbi:MAG TPA: hypothetical protein VHK00_04510 [Miltoncostaeaceae bacterium]|jgi:hypothetical protein|nr:hypothetical protein [Miltoncostaeaceae bacterium]